MPASNDARTIVITGASAGVGRGIHGPFDEQAKAVSSELELAERAALVTRLAGGAVALVGGAAITAAVAAIRRAA